MKVKGATSIIGWEGISDVSFSAMMDVFFDRMVEKRTAVNQLRKWRFLFALLYQ